MDNKKRILICDDEEGVRESLNLILSKGYDLGFAGNAKEALDYLKKNPKMDLILLDIKMPQINGLEALIEIKKKYADINILIVTGYQSAEIAAEVVKRGASGYIVKPFDKTSVLKTIQGILGQ